MFWPPVLSLLVLWCSGSDSQPVLTQPPSASVSPGSTVRLPCAMSTGFSVGGHHVYWYQHKPGASPQWLISHLADSSKHRHSGVPSRFSASKDTSANTGYLTIEGALEEDEADYYCLTSYAGGGSWRWMFGTGTQLAMTGQPETPPTVHLFPPSAEEKQSKNKATLVCLMDNFNPPDITVAWKADGTAVSNGVETTRPTKQHDKYIASSYLTLDASEYARHDEYTCEVTHKGTVYPKTVVRSECP